MCKQKIFPNWRCSERKTKSIPKGKPRGCWIEIHLVQQVPAEIQSIYGQADCTQVDPLINLGATSLADFFTITIVFKTTPQTKVTIEMNRKCTKNTPALHF